WIAGFVTVLLMWQWRGIDIVLWNIETPILRAAIWTLFVVGWLLIPLASALINHFDLFGTRQVWLHLNGRDLQALPFRTPSLYKHARHPLYVGWTIAFWAMPTMTLGHAIFAASLTAYMAIATFFEERDLVAYFGPQYETYRQTVPRFIPSFRKGTSNLG